MTGLAPAPRPCESCPYRQDVPSGIWSAEEYSKLPMYDADTAQQPLQTFQCHQHEQGATRARLCAGWVATHRPEDLLSVRINVALRELDPSIYDYETDVPVFASGAEAARHGMRDIENPSREAIQLVTKVAARRPDVRFG